MRTVILVGPAGAWTGPRPPESEIWAVNLGFRGQPDCDRIFMLHGARRTADGPEGPFLDELNACPARVLMRSPDARVARSEAFPAREVAASLRSDYFTSSAAWALGLALLEGFGRVVVHRFYTAPDSPDYLAQKSCLDYWLGYAAGQGLDVRLSADSWLGRAHPWSGGLYAYVEPLDAAAVDRDLALTLRRHAGRRYRLRPEAEARNLIGVELGAIRRYPVAPRLRVVASPGARGA